MKKKILVTGSTGFIGTYLVEILLADKYKLFVVLRKTKKNIKIALNLKKKYKNYSPIFFNSINELSKKLKKTDVNFVINLATKYLNKHNFLEMVDLVRSNILFTTAVLEALPKKKLKKYINLSSMTLHRNSNEYEPLNLYAATKKSFIDILKFYQNSLKHVNFFNLSIYDTYGPKDKRTKIIPVIIKNYFLRKTTNILSKKLELNLLNVNDVCNGIKLIIKKNIKTGDYIIKAKKFTNINKLILNTNKKINLKIKYKILNKLINKKITRKIKQLPFWKQSTTIEEDLIKYLNANN